MCQSWELCQKINVVVVIDIQNWMKENGSEGY